MRKNHVVIIDGKNLLWRNSDAFSELTAYVDGEDINTGGMYGFVAGLIRIHARYRGRIIVVWEGKNNFRFDLYPEYKNRDKRTKGQFELAEEVKGSEGRLNELLSFAGVRQFYGIGCEADDVMGTIATTAKKKGLNSIIYTGDSDLRQLVDSNILVASPGRGKEVVYDSKAVKEKHGVTPKRLPILKALAGDSSDCQPTNTMVKIIKSKGIRGSDGKLAKDKYHCVPIQKLKIGDRVLSYNTNFCQWSSKEIKNIKRFRYNGELIGVKTTTGLYSEYTPNHRCIVCTNDFFGKHYVYLMRKGDKFRVGVSKSNSSKNVGLRYRMNDEGADSCWILSVHNTLPDALFSEAMISHKYGIPDVRFCGDYSSWINKFWSSIGNLTNQARICLSAYGRLIEYPFICRENRIYSNRIFVVRACNLVDGMSVVVDDPYLSGSSKGIHDRYERISVLRRKYNGFVYGLVVDSNENYISDHILTHNSIPGLPGVGEKTAASLVSLYGSLKAINTAANPEMESEDWPVSERFKEIIWNGRKDSELFLKLTTIKTDAKLKLVPVCKDQKEVVRLLKMYKFRSLSSAAELLEIMNLGV